MSPTKSQWATVRTLLVSKRECQLSICPWRSKPISRGCNGNKSWHLYLHSILWIDWLSRLANLTVERSHGQKLFITLSTRQQCVNLNSGYFHMNCIHNGRWSVGSEVLIPKAHAIRSRHTIRLLARLFLSGSYSYPTLRQWKDRLCGLVVSVED
jgi:hypothetical protein